jgi:uncharacterized protein (AIM24 family)
MVLCQLDAEQTMFCEAGKFLWKTANVEVMTRFSTHGADSDDEAKGGLVGAAKEMGKRALAGESLAFQHFRPVGGSGLGVRRHAPGDSARSSSRGPRAGPPRRTRSSRPRAP